MIGLLIALLALGLLWVMPIGVRLAYHEDGSYVGLKFGFLKVKLYPKPKKEEKSKKKSAKSETTQKKTTKKSHRFLILNNHLHEVENELNEFLKTE